MSSFGAQKGDDPDDSHENDLQDKIDEVERQLYELKLNLAAAQKSSRKRVKKSPDPSSYGYVYILQADLRELCCDYWFGASGGVLEPANLQDFPHDSTSKVLLSDVPGDDQMSNIWNMSTYEPWPEGIPKPYTVRVPHSGKTKTHEYIAQVGRYLRAAAQHAHDPCRQPFRSAFRKATCPLMATPLIGTGWGGNQRNTGEMALELLPTLYTLANELRIDVALVTNDKEIYALMQWARSNMLNTCTSGSGLSFHSTITGERYLDDNHLQRIDELSHHGINGQLSLFIGAGASMGSRVPDWNGLVESLANELGLTEGRRKEFSKVDVYTKAAVLEAEVARRHKHPPHRGSFSSSGKANTGSRDGNGSKKALCLGDYVARRFIHSRYSVVHALLAALPVQEAITTNYDDLFEKAWHLHGSFAVLPHAPMRRTRGHVTSSKWLLKMHGCVTIPEDIVLTKSHYIRYAERYAALAGIVQASLLTRHLLFVGFSFDDDNFQRIYDPVRKARRRELDEAERRNSSSPSSDYSEPIPMSSIMRAKYFGNKKAKSGASKPGNGRFKMSGVMQQDDDDMECCGTALLLEHSVLKEELWEGDICMTPMGPAASPDASGCHDGMSNDEHMSSLARKQEIFLDILASKCAVSLQMEFLMNKKFEKALSPSELLLRDIVTEFENKLLR
mmetsp:Transcript_352/g.838  ORF Transcript_352/g.838 Transcript_352/m.838 type:complete len:674 (-) Transcript_352:2060-4081(-)